MHEITPTTPTEIKAQSLNTSDPLIDSMITRVEAKLGSANYSGPSRIFGTGIGEVLIELLMELFTNCFSQNLRGSRNALATSVREPNGFQRIMLRIKIRRELFRNSRREYREGDGDTILASVLSVAREAENHELEQLANYVGDNHFVDHGSL